MNPAKDEAAKQLEGYWKIAVCSMCEKRPQARRSGVRQGLRPYCTECDAASHALALYWRKIDMPLAWDSRPHLTQPRRRMPVGLCEVCLSRPGKRRAAGLCWTCYRRVLDVRHKLAA